MQLCVQMSSEHQGFLRKAQSFIHMVQIRQIFWNHARPLHQVSVTDLPEEGTLRGSKNAALCVPCHHVNKALDSSEESLVF